MTADVTSKPVDKMVFLRASGSVRKRRTSVEPKKKINK